MGSCSSPRRSTTRSPSVVTMIPQVASHRVQLWWWMVTMLGAPGAALGGRHLEQVGGSRRDPAELPGRAEVVTVRPVLDDPAGFDAEPVGLGLREGLAGRREDRVNGGVLGVEGDRGDVAPVHGRA